MQTQLRPDLIDAATTQRADEILRKCVHCGFCNATCPTYQVTGNELEGPRGRIYLIKEMLEGVAPTQTTQAHLDSCLTCHGCETTCPSGVEYGELIDIGRDITAQHVPRKPLDKAKRVALRSTLHPQLFPMLLKVGRMLSPVLPNALAGKLGIAKALPVAAQTVAPARKNVSTTAHARQTWFLAGCVQPALMPNVNAATHRVLDRVGIGMAAAPKVGCCGALAFHMDDQARAMTQMRANVDAWWPDLANGTREALVMNASGCAAMVKSYGRYLAGDAAYAEKAALVSARVQDIGEILAPEVDRLRGHLHDDDRPYAFHPPCTLQHWQPLGASTKEVLSRLGFDLKPFADSHMCCGSAGAYAVLQPEMANTLRGKKLAAIAPSGAQAILSANVGCISHLQGGANVPVLHWVEAVDARLKG